MTNILKAFRNIFNETRFRIASLFRGESPYTVETAVVFNLKQKDKDKVILKMHQYPELNSYFITFLNSAESGGRINGENLVFLIGPQKVGKTTFVQNNLQKFRRLKMDMMDRSKKQLLPDLHKYKSPEYVQNETKQTIFDNEHHLLFNFNFQKNQALNFTGMINHIQEIIISDIVRLNNKFTNGNFLDCEVIKQVLISQNSAQYMFIYLKDVIYCILNGTDPLQLSNEGIKSLQIFNGNIIHEEINAQSFFSINGPYKRVVEIISKDKKISQTESALRLFLSVGKRIEYEHRPETHINSWYQSGIESTNMLFDILNFLCGLGKLNKTIFQQYFANTADVLPQNASVIKAETNWIKNGNRIDVGMFLLNLDELYIYDSPQFWNFIDHLISRTANSSGLRTHFPLMIEFPNYADFENMHNMGQFDLGSPLVLEIPGYIEHTLKLSSLTEIFTQKILTRLFYRLGRNPSTWTTALSQLAKGTTSIKDIITYQAQFIKKQSIRAQAKMNLIFTHPQILPQLCDQSAQFELIQHLRLIKKVRGLMAIYRPNYYVDFISRPIFTLMIKENLLFHHYYLEYLDVTNLTHLDSLISIKNKLLSGQFIRFLQWRIRNYNRFTIYGPEAKLEYKFEKQSFYYSKFFKVRSEFQLGETYYGTRYNSMFHYAEKGISMNLTD